MTETAELKPVDDMTVQELKEELHGYEIKTGGKNKIELRSLVEDARDQQPDETALKGEAEPETVDGEVIEDEVEPTPEEATTAALSGAEPGQAQELAEAEGMALELRERGLAIGPQATIPALGELNAISVVAERLASSGIVPVAYRRKPDDVVAAILMGRELGIGPMQSLKDISVIEGRPALAAHLQLAVLRRAGVQILESEVTMERAYIKARRPDGEIGAVEWTWAEAQEVVSKNGVRLVDKDNWRNYRPDMLWARAVGRWTRRYGSDLVAGMPYTAEEVRDFDEQDAYGYGEAKPIYRQDAPQNSRPQNRAELLQRFAAIFGDGNADDCKAIAVWYVKEALMAGWKVEKFADLDPGKGNEAGQKIASAVMLMEEETPDLSLAKGVRETVAKAFARRLDGVALVGPPWRLGPDEANLPTWQQHIEIHDAQKEATAEQVADAGTDEPLIQPGEGDDDIPFGDAGYGE